MTRVQGMARIVCLFTVTMAAAAQEPGREGGGQQTVLAKPYAAEVTMDGSAVTYFDPIEVTVRITPISDTEFSRIRLVPQGVLARMYPTNAAVENEGEAGEAGEVRESGEVAEVAEVAEVGVDCRFGPSNRLKERPFIATCMLEPLPGWGQVNSLELLTRPDTQRLTVEVVVVEAGEDVVYYEELSHPFAAPKEAVVLGGFLGTVGLALLLALQARSSREVTTFESWAAVGAEAKRLPLRALGLIPFAWDVLLKSMLGGVCAMVLIVLAETTEGAASPLSLRVQDFWGGVLVGLFSVPLAQWMVGRLRDLSGFNTHT